MFRPCSLFVLVKPSLKVDESPQCMKPTETTPDSFTLGARYFTSITPSTRSARPVPGSRSSMPTRTLAVMFGETDVDATGAWLRDCADAATGRRAASAAANRMRRMDPPVSGEASRPHGARERMLPEVTEAKPCGQGGARVGARRSVHARRRGAARRGVSPEPAAVARAAHAEAGGR